MIKEYKFKYQRGIDDLQNIFAWSPSSQRDEHYTNDVNEDHDWQIYNFKDIDPTNQEAINIESARRNEENQNYIKQLRKEERFGEEYIMNIHIKENPLFDKPLRTPKDYPLESYKMVFLDERKIDE